MKNHIKIAVQKMILLLLTCFSAGCADQQSPEREAPSIVEVSPLDQNNPEITASNDKKIEQFCGNCHRLPEPQYFSRDSWYEEVKRGFVFYYRSNRSDLNPPSQREVVTYYRSKADAELRIPVRPQTTNGGLKFRLQAITTNRISKVSPAISYIESDSNNSATESNLLFSDMSRGGVYRFDCNANDENNALEQIATLDNPAKIISCDLDRDGRTDYLVADLGGFLPEDHSRGRVVWLSQTPQNRGEWIQTVLKKDIGRVADVRVADLNGDQLDDIVVGEFGWITTGSLHQMIQVPAAGGKSPVPQFKSTILDQRHGLIHSPVIDWDQDGDLDILALFSQEHETINLFVNNGAAVYKMETVHPPEDPSFGSTGIDIVDLDGDGDQDLIYTNGDTFDSFDIKYFHGIQWLENRGDGEFVPHSLATFPGVHRAKGGDLDGDGDMDIVACSLLPAKSINKAKRHKNDFDSLIWLEQISPGNFERHSLELGHCDHVTLELADFDSDGDLDIATGNFFETPNLSEPDLTIWWNELSRAD